MPTKTCQIQPFLKWAGGKRWLVDKHPEFFELEYARYIEPFLGSAAVFFHLAPDVAILNDANEELIGTYKAIRSEYQNVLRHLKRHHRAHDPGYYYTVRDQNPWSAAGRAAKLIYLNRTCWNGLYRVNLRGRFNVPIGTKKNAILATDNFQEVSEILQRATLTVGDFEATIDKARANDFVYADPPYTVKHNNNGFIKYNEGLFSWDDQIRLRDSVVRAKARGAKLLISNANHQCIHSIYKNVGKIHCLTRSSVISGIATGRGNIGEVVIQCY